MKCGRFPRLIMPRAAGLSGPFFQPTQIAACIKGMGNFLGVGKPGDVYFDFTKGFLDPRLTYARNDTVGTYFDSAGVLKTASANQPRFDYDPDTLEPLGILIEESRTNLATYGVDMSALFTTVYTVNETSTTETAPDGTSTATTIEDDNGGVVERMQRNYTTANGIVFSTSNTYTFSIFCKKTSGATHYPDVRIGYAGGASATSTDFSVFNTNTGAVTFGTGTVKSIGNFWRFTVSKAVDYADRITLFVVFDPAYNLDGSSSQNVAATGAQTVWGAQLELGAFATSYIPTSGATATRQADALSCTGTNFSSWYRQDQGTILVTKAVPTFTPGATSYLNSFSLSDGSGNNHIGQYHFNTSTNTVEVKTGGALQVQASVTDAIPEKIAIAYATNNIQQCIDGVLGTVDTSCTVPAVTALYVGANQTAVPRYGRIKSIKYWRQRIPDAALQVLTS